ncbi:YdgA family protein, partial [Enterobacter cloacae]|uniref:YdgA family protein n=1 Tax=Enterobacter cloacae TaxID=550 RepID=UPI0013D4A747
DQAEAGRKGRGGLIAAGLVVVILAAAGGAGWYFATQPGRQQPQVAAQRPPAPAAPAPAVPDGERPKITDRVGGDAPAPVV